MTTDDGTDARFMDPDEYDRYVAIAKWQKIRARLTRREALWRILELGTDKEQKIIEEVRRQYTFLAGEARARGEWVPTIDELVRHADHDNPWHPDRRPDGK